MSFGTTALAVLLCLPPSRPAALPDAVLPCVPCHNRGDSNPVAEWLASPYSETEGGRGCADCHGRPCSGTADARVRADDFSVLQLQGLREAVRLTVSATCSEDIVKAEVAVSNVGAGHLLPTGSAKRTLSLEVVARDGNRARLSGGSVVFQPRLPPFATDVSRYRFVSAENGPVHVSARLVLLPATGSRLEITRAAAVCSMPGATP